MELKFQVQTMIQRPVSEVFDAVCNPAKLCGYFTTGGASARLEEGTTVIWKFADYPLDIPVSVKQVVPNAKIVLEWAARERDYNTVVEMNFEPLGADETLVKIAESGWKENQYDLESSYMNSEGWMNMGCCLKAFLEYGINLRKGFYRSEATSQD